MPAPEVMPSDPRKCLEQRKGTCALELMGDFRRAQCRLDGNEQVHVVFVEADFLDFYAVLRRCAAHLRFAQLLYSGITENFMTILDHKTHMEGQLSIA